MATTVTYTYPVASTIPPTAVQASQVPCVTGYIQWGAGGSMSALFTHNLGIATAPGFSGKLPAISQGFPEVLASVAGADIVAGSKSDFGYEHVSGNVLQLSRSDANDFKLYVTVRSPHAVGL